MKLSLVVPVYNEEEAIPVFYKAISSYVSLNAYELELIFVNDGSKDQTETLIYELARKDSRVVPLSFTRNFGKEAALMAGLSLLQATLLFLSMWICRTQLRSFQN